MVGGGSLLQGSTESLTSDLIGDQPTSHRKMRGNALRTVQKRPLSGRSKVSNKKYGNFVSTVQLEIFCFVFFSAGIDLSCQSLTSVDVRF